MFVMIMTLNFEFTCNEKKLLLSVMCSENLMHASPNGSSFKNLKLKPLSGGQEVSSINHEHHSR